MAFDPEIVAAVLHHMNDDHLEDNLLIVQAFGGEEAASAIEAEMIGLDEQAGEWAWKTDLAEGTTRVEWPNGPISERPEIRREVVLLYRAACAKLGVEPRAEDTSRPH